MCFLFSSSSSFLSFVLSDPQFLLFFIDYFQKSAETAPASKKEEPKKEESKKDDGKKGADAKKEEPKKAEPKKADAKKGAAEPKKEEPKKEEEKKPQGSRLKKEELETERVVITGVKKNVEDAKEALLAKAKEIVTFLSISSKLFFFFF
jgi:hypothetical protein